MPSSDIPPPHLKLSQSLTYRLHRLHKLTDQVSQRAYTDVVALPMREGRCLAIVGAFEPVSVNELARRANLNKSQASRAAQRLMDDGLVEKLMHPVDGRGVLLCLTASGRRRWWRTMALIAQRNEHIFSCLSEAETRTFGALLDRLLSHNDPD